MIQTYGATLSDLTYCARQICESERDTYYEITGQPWNAEDVAAQIWFGGGKRWTFRESVGNFPAAVCGYQMVRPGVWASWFMGTDYAWRERGRQITDHTRDVVTYMLAHPEVNRLETVTLATRTRARDWYKHIGLTYESTARKASATGQDLVTYVAVRP